MTASLAASRLQAAMNGIELNPAGAFFGVDGTVYPGAPFPPVPIGAPGGQWSGFSSGVAGGLMNVADGLWLSGMDWAAQHADFLIGYPAVTIPMWPSVQIGRTNLVNTIQFYASAYKALHGSYAGMVIVLSGYSQGAMVTDQVWVLDFLSPTGVLHYLLPYVLRMYNFGDIFRTPGIALGNVVAGLAQSIQQDSVETGGIGGSLDLTVAQTMCLSQIDGQPVVQSSANFGDIYTCCPTGLNPWTALAPAAKTGNTFFKIVMQPTFVDVIEVAEVLTNLGGSLEEMVNGLKFAAEGTNAPHWQYYPQMDAIVGEMVTLGNQIVAGRISA
jgi:hypothetical protein